MNIPTGLKKYLDHMGIKGVKAQRHFLFPRLRDHYDPFLLEGVPEAVDIISEVVKHRGKILIWGDADLDGISAAALLKNALLDLGGKDIAVRIPPRNSTGFGLIAAELEEFHKREGNLVITVDVGITNIEEADTAKQLGLKLIITDHHELLGSAPDATLINPKLNSTSYPFTELAGAGVVFKLVSGLYQSMVGLSIEELSRLRPHYWMFASLGTVSDRCPLIDENRLIVRHGINYLRQDKWKSLAIWLEDMGLDSATLSVFDLYSRGISSFYAADPEEAVELLLSDDEEWMRNRYGELRQIASAWQRGKQNMIEEAERNAQFLGGMVVSASHEIDSDYLGTAAHALRERHSRPAIVLAPRHDTWHAECRGLDCTDLLSHLALFEKMFLSFGGHRKACGFTLIPGSLEEFLNSLERNPLKVLDITENEPTIFEVALDKNLSDWILLAPFGEGNPPPRLVARKIEITETANGYKAEDIPVYLPHSLRASSSYNTLFDVIFTINADGTLRVLELSPVPDQ